MKEHSYSILFPFFDEVGYRTLSDITCHDLGLDTVIPLMASKPDEQEIIRNVFSHTTDDARVAGFRSDVYTDFMNNQKLRDRVMEIFDRIEYIKSFGSVHKNAGDEITLWHLFQRLDDLRDYIKCVEQLHDCLAGAKLTSEGMKGLCVYIDELYADAGFAEMKKDMEALHVKASQVRSITVGVNLNDRLEATGLGLISVNDRQFKKSGVLSNFAETITGEDKLREGTDWDGDMHYHPSQKTGKDAFLQTLKKGAGVFSLQRTPFVDSRTRSTIVSGVMDDRGQNTSYYLEAEMNRMMSKLSRDLRKVLSDYADVAIVNISGLIPEFIYYIRLCEFTEKCIAKGFRFCKPEAVAPSADTGTKATGFYNLRLAAAMDDPENIVSNDIAFSGSDILYILTGANRGGKTTLTQGVGLMFLLAQGGMYAPAESFTYEPVDAIYTHFPADEDKTTDLGRLGEECVRFREIYDEATDSSLVLLNETFSTTSFEEGYYIAKDSVRALLKKEVRTIYNTHMHKLGLDIDEINSDKAGAKAVSMVMRTDAGERSFKVELAPPEGSSFASDIAKKYGVTYDMLTSS